MICAWCPTFDPRHPSNKGKSHGMCKPCAAKLHADLDAKEQKA